MWQDTAPSKGAAGPSSDVAVGPARVLALVAGVTVYAVASHLLMVHAAAAPWAVAALFGPLLLAILAAGIRRRHAPTLAASAALLAVLVAVVWRGGVTDMHRLYVLQHAGIHAAMGLGFGLTLRPGSTALITGLAQRVHRHFTPAMRRYTRLLTWGWTLYFVAIIVLSFLIYALAPWPVWSLFGNLVSPLAAAVFFVGEHLWRYWRHPEFERLSMRSAIDAWRQGPVQAEA